jgi:hypothetical protein
MVSSTALACVAASVAADDHHLSILAAFMCVVTKQEKPHDMGLEMCRDRYSDGLLEI